MSEDDSHESPSTPQEEVDDLELRLSPYEAVELHRVLLEREMHFGMNGQDFHAAVLKDINRHIESELYAEGVFETVIEEEQITAAIMDELAEEDQEADEDDGRGFR